MKRLKKLQELNLMFKPPVLAMLLEADTKTVRRWLFTEDAHIHQDRHKQIVDEIYEISKPIIKRRKANRDRINGVMI